MCEQMWSNAFKYTEDKDENGDDNGEAYTMWFFDAMNNPNDGVSELLHGPPSGGVNRNDECHVQWHHKGGARSEGKYNNILISDTYKEDYTGKPGPEDDTFTECHPWKENACCHQETVASRDAIHGGYAEENLFRWDRCGPMSQECERFFVQEACLYECDSNLANYRVCSEQDIIDKKQIDIGLLDHVTKEPDLVNCTAYGGNRWQIANMPIKASYCDSWYDACMNDMFCGHGSFRSCHKEMAPVVEEEEVISAAWAVPTLATGGVVLVVGAFFAFFLIYREKQGKAVFKPLTVVDENDNAKL